MSSTTNKSNIYEDDDGISMDLFGERELKRRPGQGSEAATSTSSISSDEIFQENAASMGLLDRNMSITRTIAALDYVKIPRRPNEGKQPLFERPELRQSIRQRIERDINENDNNNNMLVESTEPKTHGESMNCASPSFNSTISSNLKRQRDRSSSNDFRPTFSSTETTSKSKQDYGGSPKSSTSERKRQRGRSPPTMLAHWTTKNRAEKTPKQRDPPINPFRLSRRSVAKLPLSEIMEHDHVLHINWHKEGIHCSAASMDTMMSKALLKYFRFGEPRASLQFVKRDARYPFSTWLIYDSADEALKAMRKIKRTEQIFVFNGRFEGDQEFPYDVTHCGAVKEGEERSLDNSENR